MKVISQVHYTLRPSPLDTILYALPVVSLASTFISRFTAGKDNRATTVLAPSIRRGALASGQSGLGLPAINSLYQLFRLPSAHCCQREQQYNSIELNALSVFRHRDDPILGYSPIRILLYHNKDGERFRHILRSGSSSADGYIVS